jgi:DNA-binding transcriptional MerR regulator/effector-binding domain-containing protein
VFRIAAFARVGGASPKVLRDYDRLGIFRPAWVDPATGYRLYSPAQLPELRRVLALRDLGLGLADLARLAQTGADLRAVLEARRTALERERADIDRRLAALGIELEGSGSQGGRGGAADVVVRELRPELVAIRDVAAYGGDLGEAFDTLESAIRDAGVRAGRPPGALVHGDLDGPDRTEIYVPITRPTGTIPGTELPGVRAATALHHGGYATLGATIDAVGAHVAALGLRAASPMRIVYLQFGAPAELALPREYLADHHEAYLTEVQVPIAPAGTASSAAATAGRVTPPPADPPAAGP